MNISPGDQRAGFTAASAVIVAQQAAYWAGLIPAWAAFAGPVLVFIAVVLAIAAATVRAWYR